MQALTPPPRSLSKSLLLLALLHLWVWGGLLARSASLAVRICAPLADEMAVAARAARTLALAGFCLARGFCFGLGCSLARTHSAPTRACLCSRSSGAFLARFVRLRL